MTATARRRLRRSGVTLAWLAVAALAGTPLHAAAVQAVYACDSLRSEQGSIPFAALPSGGGRFRLGVTSVRSLVDRVSGLPTSDTPIEHLARRIIYDNDRLTSELLSEVGT